MGKSITVRGKEYPLEMTVQAFCDIADLCPGKSIERIDEIAKMPIAQSIAIMAKIAACMSKGAEESRKFDEAGYVPDPLSADAILTLPVGEYKKIAEEITEAMKSGFGGQTVEVKPEKKTVKKGNDQSS